MKRNRMISFLLCLVMLLCLSPVQTARAEDEGFIETPLKLINDTINQVQLPAGGTVHLVAEVALAESAYCWYPTFFVEAEKGVPLSFDNIKVSNSDETYGTTIWMDRSKTVIVEFDVTVEDLAKIGQYEYTISYTNRYADDDDDESDFGKVTLTLTVVSEMTEAQVNVISTDVFTAKAGDTASFTFRLKNQGELQALNTYVYVDYSPYLDYLIPTYTPLDQKVGSMIAGEERIVTVTYKIAEDTPSQLMRLRVETNCKLVTGESATPAGGYIYIQVKGKEASATPTPPATTEKSAQLYLHTVKQSVAEPKAGEKLTVSFYLENKGTAAAKNVKISMLGLSSSGFEPIDSEPYLYLSSIAAGKKTKVELTVKVGEMIPEGLNQLQVRYEYEYNTGYSNMTGGDSVELNILNVKNPKTEEVPISRPKLMVSNFYTDLEEVKAGSVFDFTFEVFNTNDEINAKNIKVTVNASSSAFSVTSGGNSFFVSEIKAGEKELITINLKASAAATTGAYPINITMEYEYEGMVVTSGYDGEVVTEELLLQVKENLRPSVENVFIGGWDTPVIYQPTTMNFEFYNMGKSTLNNVYITIEGDFLLSNGSNSYYVGNIMSGMPEYVEFEVIPEVEGDAVGIMVIHMEDSNGDEVTMEKEFSAYVMGTGSWEDPGYFEPGFEEPGWSEDPSVPADADEDDGFSFKEFFSNIYFKIAGGCVVALIIIAVVYIVIAKKKKGLDDYED